MTLALKTTAVFTNVNLPVVIVSPEEAAVAAIAGLNVWLEGRASDIDLSSGIFTGWRSRVGGLRWVPALAQAPLVLSAGSRRFLRFGYGGGGLAANANGVLREQDDSNVLSASGYTIGIVARGPVPAEAAATGAWVGNQVSDRFFAGLSSTASIQVFHASATGGALITYGTEPRPNDGVWHYYVLSYDFAGKVMRLRKNGQQIFERTSVGSEISTATGGLRMVLGGSAETFSASRLTGDLAGVLHVSGRALHLLANAADLTALETYLAQIRTQLSA
ncbi:LamG-like jellyroll fold domain-containing protein [Pseudoroseomonas cervicalis]|uniref:Uncharacterized protein n=1 Tax=Pseudoroseomonas cervicalis ATCC 49957 TaxID=525371 RepID=D5RTE3_9PROT|nr:serine protease [Pseudoroseomonas cervicalis]EFH09435.1 hypothetical protein HMPREF0731_4355 [Pseudoroseomonas cervicalis ATCC 49957]